MNTRTDTRKPARQPKAGIIYRGPSMLTGQPIVVVATFTKSNRKTGGMLQTYILTDDGRTPIEAIRTGADVSICGDCPHRGDGQTYGSRSCYVNVAQGVTVVWKGVQRGTYGPGPVGADDMVALGRGRMVRLGTYGDPAAVPASIWHCLLRESAGHTGYTHQWRMPMMQRGYAAGDLFRSFVMASADSEQDARDAQDAGWRTFRVRTADEPLMPREFACPASDEAGHKVQCADCRACGGADGRKGSPAIIAHGALASRFAANRIRLSAI